MMYLILENNLETKCLGNYMYQQSTNRENKSNMIGQTRFFLIKVNLLTMKKAEVRHGNSYFFLISCVCYQYILKSRRLFIIHNCIINGQTSIYQCNKEIYYQLSKQYLVFYLIVYMVLKNERPCSSLIIKIYHKWSTN